MAPTQIATIPPYIPVDDLPKYGGPQRTRAYGLLAQGKLKAVKHGRLTLVTADSFTAYMAALPAYQPGAAA
jgi:hypothetical protein